MTSNEEEKQQKDNLAISFAFNLPSFAKNLDYDIFSSSIMPAILSIIDNEEAEYTLMSGIP